jgi:ketosteroid isomerase-like protein
MATATIEKTATLTTEDRLEIAELIARFAHYSDFCEWDKLASLYTDDAVTEMEGLAISYRGPTAQVEHARESAEQTGGKNRHYNYNLFIETQDGAVIARYMFSNVNAGAEVFAAKTVVSGRMTDTVVKTADGWKIARRFVQFDQAVSFDF